MSDFKGKAELLEEAKQRKVICLYLLEKKSKRAPLVTAELKSLAPDVFVMQKLSEGYSTDEGPFEYGQMIMDQLYGIMKSYWNSSAHPWNDEFITELLTNIGVTEITQIFKDFSRKPTGYYIIEGAYDNKFKFRLYEKVYTE